MPHSDPGPISAERQREAVLRLENGEDLDLVSREIGVDGATLSEWREAYQRSDHRERTLDYFREAANKKQGFYDAAEGGALVHSVWQRRVRTHLLRRFAALRHGCTSVLDVGCGNGDLVAELAKENPTIQFRGNDFSAEMVEVANERYAGISNLTYAHQDLLSIATSGHSADLVICLNMFHHLHEGDLDAGMEAMAAVCNRSLLFEFKNANNFWNRHLRPKGSFPHTMLAPKRAKSCLAAQGLRVVNQWNIFGLDLLSPIVMIEFARH